MQSIHSTCPDGWSEEDQRASRRLLRRLRITLLILSISFLGTVVWFAYGA